jgi:hypothetical protein
LLRENSAKLSYYNDELATFSDVTEVFRNMEIVVRAERESLP